MEHIILWMLYRASLQIRTPRAVYKAKLERAHVRRLGRNFRAQLDAWWCQQKRKDLDAHASP